jgi:hypothetical protein
VMCELCSTAKQRHLTTISHEIKSRARLRLAGKLK